jgi:hypothetical protein
VPQDRFLPFWQIVRDALKPGGLVFFTDELASGERDFEQRLEGDAVQRTIRDGRRFRAVKVFYTPSELRAKLNALGWHAEVEAAGPDFYFGRCSRNDDWSGLAAKTY